MFDSLRSCSDRDIVSRLKSASVQDRQSTLDVVRHLIEFERRKLHLKLGYSSLFDYCTTCLAYSEGAAMRRITAARCIARFPEVCALIESGRVNLSTVSLVNRILTPENHKAVLRRIQGKSQKDVQAIVAEFEPRAALPPDRVKPLVVRVPDLPSAVATVEDEIHRRSGGKESATARTTEESTSCEPTVKASSPPARLERHALIQFTVREGFLGKVEKIRAIAAHRLRGNTSMEDVFEFLADYFLTREDPRERHARRQVRKRQLAGPRRTCSNANDARKISARLRDEVFVRNDNQCAYVGPTGHRCGASSALQIDHRVPVARGGSAKSGNLRLLCARHNRFEAQRIMGRCGPRDGPGRR